MKKISLSPSRTPSNLDSYLEDFLCGIFSSFKIPSGEKVDGGGFPQVEKKHLVVDKLAKGKISAFSKRAHDKNSLISKFRTAEICPLNRKQFLERLLKTVLEEDL